jgi:integrase
MRRTTLKIKRVRVRDILYHSIAVPNPGGGRTRRFFRDEAEAKTYLELCRIEQRNHGLAAFSLTESARVEAVDCSKMLSAVGATLRDATKFFIDHIRATNRSCSVRAAIDELLASKKVDGASKRYLGDLRVRLNAFAADFGSEPIAALTTRRIDDWLRGLTVGGVTRNSYRRRLSTLFSNARRRGYIDVNPVKNVERAGENPEPVGILTVEETKDILDAASPDMVSFWAIGAFAGLRTAEIQRLTWDEIHLEDAFIEVKAAKSKTASRRLITIQPNLRAWLDTLADQSGPVCPVNLYMRARLDRAQAGLDRPWPNNALRHSYASYYLATFGDASKLALEMGNSPRMIFTHYRELVRPSDARAYWNIHPDCLLCHE